MSRITQDIKFRLSLIKYAEKYGVSKAARKYKTNRQYVPKPYEQMQYPGQRVQVDVKFVPAACLVGDTKRARDSA